MALTAVERTNIVKVTVALFNAAPGASGLSDFTTFYEANGRDLNRLAINLSNNNIFKSLYPNYQDANTFATQLLSAYGLQGNTDAIAFVTSRFNTGVSKGQIAYEAALAVNNTTATTGDYATARALFNNKAMVAENYSVNLVGQAVDIGTLQGVLSNVTASAASVTAANNANLLIASQSLQLTTGQDNLTGTSGPDTFISNVVQNSLGQQVNTLGSGDSLQGGAGADTLSAKITAGAFIGGSASQPIQPIIRSVETIKLQAVSSGVTNLTGAVAFGQDTQVYVNAKDMSGVNKIGSNYSDADLIILGANTLDSTGVVRPVSALTVGMEYTGNADTRFGASDLSVYFDQDYLTATPTNTSSIEVRMVDNVELKVNNKPLTAFDAVSFSVNGQLVVTDITQINRGLTGTAAYNEVINAINARLAILNITGVSVTAQPDRTTIFSDDVSGFSQGTVAGTYTPILVTSNTSALTLGQARLAATTLNFNGLNTQVPASGSQAQLVTINVDLEKAGLAGDGGNLIIGSMNKNSSNDFNGVTTNTATKSGIEQFNISVNGDATKATSLASLQSTNNNLRVVNAKTDATLTGTSFAALKIGNARTGEEVNGVRSADSIGLKVSDAPTVKNATALKDVQTFDASGLKGDLTLFAGLTPQVVAKYMNLTDSPAAAGVDNVAFTYTGGTGNDYINLFLDKANLAAAGTTTREDFGLTINGGAGNDQIVVEIGDGIAVTASVPAGGANVLANWYQNSKINANLAINGGTGDDVIRNMGAGDYVINAGDGNDTVYSDNSGSRAVFVFNVADGDAATAGNQYELVNLLSQPAASVAAVNANLTVTFRGIASKVTTIADSLGKTTNVAISDLSVNQAIKEAINKDVVLNKLLIAQDGPGNTLVVRSLVDGLSATTDLAVTFGNTALSAAQAASATPVTLFTAAGAPLVVDGYVTSFAQTLIAGAYADITGANSTQPSDSTITGGAGNDVIVLSTDKDATGILFASNETVKYEAGAFGNDTVVNFVAGAAAGADKFDFAGLGGKAGNYGSFIVDKSIVAQAATVANDSAAKVAALFTDSATAITHVYVAYDAANIGTVYSVTDAAGTAAGNVVATLVGTINLGATGWATLADANFA